MIHYTKNFNSLKKILKKRWGFFVTCTSVIFFILSICSISLSLSKIHTASITLESDHPDNVTLYFSSSLSSPDFTEKKSVSQKKISAEKETLTFKVPAIFTSRLRIDPGEQPGKFKIYQLTITQALGKETVLSHDEIYAGFHCLNERTHMTLADDFVEVTSTDNDPQIVSNIGLVRPFFPLFIIIPAGILTFFLYSVISRYSAEQCFTFFFPQRERPSSNTSVIQSLDGLRGFAALMVVAEHTWQPFLGVGHSGVMIFFTLSGFLLARPFVEAPERLFNAKSISRYIQRRMQRILPLYFVYLFLVYGMTLRLGDFILHVFFIKGLGHLWALPQEMAFYTLFPFILLVHYFLLRNNLFFILLFLVSIIFSWYSLFPTSTMYLYGMFYEKLPFMLPAFLSGTVVAFLYPRFCKDAYLSKTIKNILTIGAVAIIIVFLFFSNAHFFNSSEIYAFTYRREFGIFAATLIAILLLTQESFLTRFFSNPVLVSTGVISYSLYLFHPLVIALIDKIHLTGGVRFTLATCISYFFACFTYNLIEIPFLTTNSAKGQIPKGDSAENKPSGQL